MRRRRRRPIRVAAVKEYEAENPRHLLVFEGARRVEPGDVGYFDAAGGRWVAVDVDLAGLGFPVDAAGRLPEVSPAVNNGPRTLLTAQTLAVRGGGGAGVSGIVQVGLVAESAGRVGVLLTAAAIETRTLKQPAAAHAAVVKAFEGGKWDASWCLVYEVETYAQADPAVEAENRRIVVTERGHQVELNAASQIPGGGIPLIASLGGSRYAGGTAAIDEAMDPGRPMTVNCWRIHDRYVRTKLVVVRQQVELEPPYGSSRVLWSSRPRVAVFRRPRAIVAAGVPADELVRSMTGADLEGDWELLERYKRRRKIAVLAVGAAGVVAKRLTNSKKNPTTLA